MLSFFLISLDQR